MNNCGRMSRRLVLTSAALSIGAVTTVRMVSQAAAQAKLSEADAQYQPRPKGDQRCDGCVNFQPPTACKFVQGNISPNGWCALFTAKTKP